METITTYKTSDGQEFTDLNVAKYHEAKWETVDDIITILRDATGLCEALGNIREFLMEGDNLDRLEEVFK